jgi:hypothetical protein
MPELQNASDIMAMFVSERSREVEYALDAAIERMQNECRFFTNDIEKFVEIPKKKKTSEKEPSSDREQRLLDELRKFIEIVEEETENETEAEEETENEEPMVAVAAEAEPPPAHIESGGFADDAQPQRVGGFADD